MSTLHLIRVTNSAHSGANNSIALLNTNDVVVFIDDGIYNINQLILNDFIEVIGKESIYFIDEHAKARAIQAPSNISAINMAKLLTIALSCTRTITWQ